MKCWLDTLRSGPLFFSSGFKLRADRRDVDSEGDDYDDYCIIPGPPVAYSF